ncbi:MULTISPECIES: membrane lipoprotein lipid attachment site-containing protein [unclassified Solibacillus]|uniref:membrane lipoprotein lipid attachment site-containing protein n=1 Tax=unclassified Solibacillus TaxID=2637870 RepID=UPI0030F817DB
MKKLFFTLSLIFVLAACGTEDTTDITNNVPGNTTDDVTQGDTNVEEKMITLYKSDANAENTVPFEEEFEGDEGNLVSFIFEEVNEHDVELLDYTLETESKSLVLNLGDDIYTIQGSAGARMFVETLARSYFENLPDIDEITFIHKGSYEPALDHMNIGQPYLRSEFDM